MEAKPLVLSIDCGTQSMRAIIFDKQGEAVAGKAVKYDEPYFSLQKGWAEQWPDYWWKALCECLRRLADEAGSSVMKRLIALSISCMRDTYVCLDKDMRVIRSSILWLDQRIARDDVPIPPAHSMLFMLAGMKEVVRQQRRVTRTVWMQENQEDTYNRMAFYASLECWLNYKLSGRLVDSSANECGHIPYDYKNGAFRRKGSLMWQATPVDPALLPPFVKAGTEIGKVTRKAALETGLPEGLVLIAGATDKGCETLGCGVVDTDIAAISFGTTATVQLSMNRYMEPQRFLPAYPAAMPGYWNPEIQIYRGYWMVKWFSQNFGMAEQMESERTGERLETLLDKLLCQTPPGCDGLMLQPYWFPGLKMLESKGSIIGFSDYHTRAHLYRAILEGINYGLMDGLRTLQKRSRTTAKALCVSGGGSRSDYICQMTSDMFGLPAYRCHTNETSALGAAIMSFVSQGVHGGWQEAVDAMVHYKDCFTPEGGRHELYRKMFENVYRKLYPRIKPLYSTMFNMQQNMQQDMRRR